MPIKHLKKAVKKARTNIRQHWSQDEAKRRHEMAEVMQMQLMTVLGFQPAPVVEK